MKKNISSFIVGLLFSLGLGISGMTQAQKVVGFLDVFGSFDPSLMFVMIAAIAVHSIAYRLIRKRSSPLLNSEWLVPTKKDITPALIVGSLLFGIGWGIAGFCPGPAIVSLVSLKLNSLVFVASMIGGMLLFKWVDDFLKMKK